MKKYKCPHLDYCKKADDCPPDEHYWLNCWVYRSFESILDREVFKNKILKQIFREEHDHHREEESPYD